MFQGKRDLAFFFKRFVDLFVRFFLVLWSAVSWRPGSQSGDGDPRLGASRQQAGAAWSMGNLGNSKIRFHNFAYSTLIDFMEKVQRIHKYSKSS